MFAFINVNLPWDTKTINKSISVTYKYILGEQFEQMKYTSMSLLSKYGVVVDHWNLVEECNNIAWIPDM